MWDAPDLISRENVSSLYWLVGLPRCIYKSSQCRNIQYLSFFFCSFGMSSVEVAVSKTTPNYSRQASNNQQEEELQPISANISAPRVENVGSAHVTFEYRRDPGLRRLGSILALLPMFFSIWSACTRLVDNMHFPADVVGGAVLGSGIAVYCHPLW